MKNYWLIIGGAFVGFGVASFISKKGYATTKGQDLLQVVGGVVIIIGGIYGFKNVTKIIK